MRHVRLLFKNWNSDRLSPHTSRRTSPGFNPAPPAPPASLITTPLSADWPKVSPWHRPLLGGPALPALLSLLLPNQLAFSIHILHPPTTVCVLQKTLTFKLRFYYLLLLFRKRPRVQNVEHGGTF